MHHYACSKTNQDRATQFVEMIRHTQDKDSIQKTLDEGVDLESGLVYHEALIEPNPYSGRRPRRMTPIELMEMLPKRGKGFYCPGKTYWLVV